MIDKIRHKSGAGPIVLRFVAAFLFARESFAGSGAGSYEPPSRRREIDKRINR